MGNNNNEILNGIFEIFGISNSNENEVANESMIDDGFFPEETTKSPTNPTTRTTTTTTTTTTTASISSTVADVLPDDNGKAVSKIIFSDDEIEARNKDLANSNRIYVGHIPLKPSSTESTPRRNTDPESRIFFPDA